MKELPIGSKLNTWNYMPINYIHEVQNLYFAITNKELNIQL